jgi:hypothetical protein
MQAGRLRSNIRFAPNKAHSPGRGQPARHLPRSGNVKPKGC